MTRVEWSPSAIDDLDSIRSFIARDSPLYANLVVRRLIAAADRLTTFPLLGRVVPELGVPELRELIVRPFRLVYRVRPELIEIVTVVRSPKLFPESAA